MKVKKGLKYYYFKNRNEVNDCRYQKRRLRLLLKEKTRAKNGLPITVITITLISSSLVYNDRALLIKKLTELIDGKICEDTKVSLLEFLAAFMPNKLSTKELSKILEQLKKKNPASQLKKFFLFEQLCYLQKEKVIRTL